MVTEMEQRISVADMSFTILIVRMAVIILWLEGTWVSTSFRIIRTLEKEIVTRSPILWKGAQFREIPEVQFSQKLTGNGP